MHINQIFELSLTLDTEKFQKVINRAYKKAGYLAEDEEKYIDQSLAHKGMIVTYRNSQYKKKVNLIVDSGQTLDGVSCDKDKIIRKLDKRIREYFDFKYQTSDFCLSGMRLAADIDVGSRQNVLDYLKVIQRIGRVKGFSLSDYDYIEGIDSFCLEGNSNGIEFLMYDLEGLLIEQIDGSNINKKEMKSMIKSSKGIIRSEVRLTKPKTIRDYTDEVDVYGQLVVLMENCRDIFLDVFTRIIPFGDFYKKDRAVEIVKEKIEDDILRRRMLRLIALVPEKKSLLLAQKAMNCRNVKKVMEAFAKLDISPVTISKRQDIKWLKNIYEYLLEK